MSGKWVKFTLSWSDKNWLAFESVRSSAWTLKSQVKRNSLEVDTDEMRDLKFLETERKTQNGKIS